MLTIKLLWRRIDLLKLGKNLQSLMVHNIILYIHIFIFNIKTIVVYTFIINTIVLVNNYFFILLGIFIINLYNYV